jgi:NADH-quinone oxidoreductase subunit J
MNTLFFIAAAVAIFSTIMVITRNNAVHALLFLILSLLSVAVTMYTSGAPYAAALEIIVYAGAIMILFIFVVMMLNLSKSPDEEKKSTGIKSWIVPIILTIILTADFVVAFMQQRFPELPVQVITVKTVAISMFTTYLLGVELAGMLLLAGIVGAYHLGRTKKRNLHRYLEN